MSRDPSTRFRRKLFSYLARDVSLKDFRRWFIPASWDIAKQDSREAQQLVYDIELHLIEHENGLSTEDELRKRLTKVLSSYAVFVGKRQM